MIINIEEEYDINLAILKDEYENIWIAFVDEELGYDDADFLQLVIDTVGIEEVKSRLGLSPDFRAIRLL